MARPSPPHTKNILVKGDLVSVILEPLKQTDIQSSAGHTAAILINFITLVLAFVTVFLYNKRELQVKLCYVLSIFWLVITGMISFCPFIVKSEIVTGETVNYLAPVIGMAAIVLSVIAARMIKKDIELLKSADRIR